MLANRLSNLVSDQRMLVGGIVADNENARRLGNILDGGVAAFCLGSGQCAHQGREVGGAVMIEIIRSQHRARKAAEQVILFVGRAIGTDHGDGRRSVTPSRRL